MTEDDCTKLKSKATFQRSEIDELRKQNERYQAALKLVADGSVQPYARIAANALLSEND